MAAGAGWSSRWHEGIVPGSEGQRTRRGRRTRASPGRLPGWWAPAAGRHGRARRPRARAQDKAAAARPLAARDPAPAFPAARARRPCTRARARGQWLKMAVAAEGGGGGGKRRSVEAPCCPCPAEIPGAGLFSEPFSFHGPGSLGLGFPWRRRCGAFSEQRRQPGPARPLGSKKRSLKWRPARVGGAARGWWGFRSRWALAGPGRDWRRQLVLMAAAPEPGEAGKGKVTRGRRGAGVGERGAGGRFVRTRPHELGDAAPGAHVGFPAVGGLEIDRVSPSPIFLTLLP